MRARRTLVGAAVCGAMVLGFGGTALAGEWAPGHGTTPVKDSYIAGSICAFSGADESDDTEDHGTEAPDDGLWGSTPAGGRAQSPGQIIATFGPGAAAPGTDCRGFASFKD